MYDESIETTISNNTTPLLGLGGVSGSMCKKHKPMNKKLGYVAWNEWADLKTRRGHIQRQCPDCGYYFFKCEM